MTALDPYTAELGGFTFGLLTSAPWEDPPAGLGLPTPQSNDTPRHGHGSAGGRDLVRMRPISVPLLISEDDAEEAEDLFDDLKAAWQPSDVDVELRLRLAGPERSYFGRPRGLDLDLQDAHQGAISGIVGQFDALDPWGYGEEDDTESDDSAATLTIDNPGNVANPLRSKVLLTCEVGSGTAPFTIENLDDDGAGAPLTFVAPTGTVLVDLYTWTVTDDSGNNLDAILRPDSDWPVLVPGDNQFAFDGFESIVATWRPAYL